MKEISIQHHQLQDNQLTIIPSVFFGNPQVVLNGKFLKKERKTYDLTANIGSQFELKITHLLYDHFPKIAINGEDVPVAKTLKWYEYVWMALPGLLVLQGGVLGALLGVISLKYNSIVFRTEKSIAAKYLITAGINLAVAAIFFVIATAVRNSLGR